MIRREAARIRIRAVQRRGKAAKRGWVTRRRREAARSKAAKKGWITRRKLEAARARIKAAQRRSRAAKKGWITRRRREAKKKPVVRMRGLGESAFIGLSDTGIGVEDLTARQIFDRFRGFRKIKFKMHVDWRFVEGRVTKEWEGFLSFKVPKGASPDEWFKLYNDTVRKKLDYGKPGALRIKKGEPVTAVLLEIDP